jgi:hypothetical protein
MVQDIFLRKLKAGMVGGGAVPVFLLFGRP